MTYHDILKHFTNDEQRLLESNDHRRLLPLLIHKAVSQEISQEQLFEICHEEIQLRLHEAQENELGPVRLLNSKEGSDLTLMITGLIVLRCTSEDHCSALLTPENEAILQKALCHPEERKTARYSIDDPQLEKILRQIDTEAGWWKNSMRIGAEDLRHSFLQIANDNEYGLQALSQRPNGIEKVLTVLDRMAHWRLAADFSQLSGVKTPRTRFRIAEVLLPSHPRSR